MKSLINIKRCVSLFLSLTLMLSGFGVVSANAAPKSITVGKGGDFATITEALNSVDYTPTKEAPLVINIEKGVYEESFTVDKPYISLVNNGKAEDVVITYDKSVGNADPAKRAGTEQTATVAVSAGAHDFKAENITFQNSNNLSQEEEYSQAVALVSSADRTVFTGCRFIGRQDTLYLKGASKGASVTGSANQARAYLENCYIEGTVDFIFGDGTAVFRNCDINMAYRAGGGYFTAANTTLYNVGYVFNGCNFTVDEKYTAEDGENIYLGRPWQCDKDHPTLGSSVLIMNSSLPKILNEKGFALWDDTTVADKVRFMEYNNRVGALPENTATRADYVTILTDGQAAAYKPHNILRGNDLWNPANLENVPNSPASEITFASYDVSIPKGDVYKLSTYMLPMGSKGTVTYNSLDENIVKIDQNGNITANEIGSAFVTASLANGFTVRTKVTVTAPRTDAPVISDISIDYGSTLDKTDRIRGSYTFTNKEDTENDRSLIRWIAVDGATGKEFIVSEGRGESFKEYNVTDREIGCYIKMEVYPESSTSYGKVGAASSAVSKTVVGGDANVYLKEDFSSLSDSWSVSSPSAFEFIKDGSNSFITGAEETNASKLVYKGTEGWGDNTTVYRMRFNPAVDGLSGDSYENLFVNYKDENNYYKVKITRGGNTKSLRWYLIKATGGTEQTLASDEESMKGNVNQNSGEDNPYFYVVITKKGSTVKADFIIENTRQTLSTLTANDSEALSGGYVGFETYGKKNAVLLDYINVYGESIAKEKDVRIFIAGDSTAKSYGDGNTIGGWGEYIPYYFSEDVDIINKAEGGRSSRSFMNQGRLDEICNEAHEGDYVFIQFGINDGQTDEAYRLEYSVALGQPDSNGVYPSIRPQKSKTPQLLLDAYANTGYPYSDTYYPQQGGTFKWYIEQYVDRVRETGATPVLLTSICRVFFDSDGKITPHHGENDGYLKVVKQVAEEKNCDFIDFYEVTKNLYESYGYTMVQGLANIKADGSMDLTHYNKFGANIIASKFAQAVGEAGIGLEGYITPSRADVERTDGLKSAKLYLVGDEYFKDYTNDNSANVIEKGSISKYMTENLSQLIDVVPLGAEGASSKSYINTQQYKDFIDGVCPGDYVLLHFGTNDKQSGEGFTSASGDKETEGSFKYYLYNYYVKPIKEKKAVPIIITPIAQREFSGETFSYSDGGYTDAARELVSEEQIYFCNMTDNMSAIYKEAGSEASLALNAYDDSGSLKNYLSDVGAKAAAESFLKAMKSSSATFKDYITLPDEEEEIYITKGSFAEDMVNALSLKGTGLYGTFSDLPTGRSYVKACGTLKELNIAKGDDKNCFYPENVLTATALKELISGAKTALNLTADVDDIMGDVGQGFITEKDAYMVLVRLHRALG